MARRNQSLERLSKRLAAIPVAARKAAQVAVTEGATDIAETARQLAEPSRDSGDLINSIEVTGPGETTPAYSQPGGSMVVPELTAVVTVGIERVRYPHLVEYGTEHAEAQPFFWPAYRLRKQPVKKRISRTIQKAIRKAMEGKS